MNKDVGFKLLKEAIDSLNSAETYLFASMHLTYSKEVCDMAMEVLEFKGSLEAFIKENNYGDD